VAPMLQQGVPVTLPVAGNTVDKPDTQEQTVVTVDGQNNFWVNGVQVDRSEMAGRVAAVLEDKKEKIVYLKGDTDASYGAVMAAMDDLRKAQIEDIGLITDRKLKPGETAGGK
jgi:biopolymer transport protein TolR